MAFAVSSVIAAIGVGVAAVGVGTSLYNSEKAASANSAAAATQGQIAQLQAGNVDVQKQQLALTTSQQQLQIKTQESVIQDQSQADAIRQQAAELDATRQRREAVRQGIVARAQSLTNATNQGAGSPGSTAIKQGAGSVTNATNTNILGINQNLDIGNQLYSINKDITSQYLNAQQANSTYVNQSEQLQSQELDTQKQVYALGGTVANDYSSAALSAGNAALGTGLLSAGAAVANSYPTLNKLTNYFGSTGQAAGNNYGYTSQTYGNGLT